MKEAGRYGAWMQVRARSPKQMLLIGIGAVHLLLAIFITRPLILPDEAGYLLNARRIATLGEPSQLVYFPGYSLILAPLFVVFSELAAIFRGVQVINALLAVASAGLSISLAETLFPGRSTRHRYAAVAVVGLYPSYLLFGSLSVSENLFVPATLAILVLLLRADANPSTTNLAALAAVSGLAILIHQRAVVFAIAVIIAAVARFGIKTRQVATVIVVTAITAGAGVLLARGILGSNPDVYEFGISERTSVLGLIADNLDPRSLFTLPFTIMGQALYITVATLGLAPLALIHLAGWWRPGVPVEGRALAAIWLASVLGTTIIISGLFMNQGTGDQAVYGRYLEAVLAPFLLIGVMALLDADRTPMARHLPLLPAIMAPILVAVRGVDAFTGRQQLLNIATIQPIVELVGIDLFWMATTGVIGIALLFTTARRWGVLGLLPLAVAYAISTGFIFERAVSAQNNFDQPTELDDKIETYVASIDPSQRCVAIDDSTTASPWFQQNYRLESLDVDFLRWDSTSGSSPCGVFVLTSRADLETSIPGAKLVAVEPERNFLLWLTSEPTMLTGPPFPEVAMPTAFLPDLGQIVLSEPKIVAIEDDHIEVSVELTNNTDRALVPSRSLPSGFGGVSVGLEWMSRSSQDRLHEPRRSSLGKIVWPGQSVILEGELPYEVDDFEIGDGLVRVHTEVVQEGWRWAGRETGEETLVTLEPRN